MTPPGRVARAIEFAVALSLSLAIVILHFNVLQHAGPLWRDEISSLRLATMPTFAEFWRWLVYDPVPALFFGVLRLWTMIIPTPNDEALRYLGLVVGCSSIVALWIAAWTLKKAPPTWALVLLGLSPVALVWGDSLRAYGLGCVANIFAVTFMSRLLRESPAKKDVAFALLAALCSVHTLFPNSLLLFASAAGAIAVALYRRWWRSGLTVLGIGLVAALSLIPYAGVIRGTQSWSPLASNGIDLHWILTMMYRAIESGGRLPAALWLIGAGLCVLMLFCALLKPALLRLEEADRDVALFAGVTLVLALVCTALFFTAVGWSTSLWYYLPCMAVVVVCIESLTRLARKHWAAILANSVLVFAAAALVAPRAMIATNVRLTNVDLTTMQIETLATPDDLVVVDNYFYAISFNRYYRGRAPWVTVPNTGGMSLHRWDLLTGSMREVDPIRPVLERIDATLRAGHHVFVVGFAPLGHAPAEPPSLPPAPAGTSGWTLWGYMGRWTSQIAYTSQTHAEKGGVLEVPCTQPISVVENVRAVVVSGWKDATVAAAKPAK